MQKYLRELKPSVFDDLIAMNALYRPGPLEYIPDFIKRKHGMQAIAYDVPDMEEYLKDTYGITVYQEQVMLLSQKLAGFTKGQADTLRKAMGKKQKEVLDKMKGQFMDGASAKGHPADKLEKIWTDWEAFASYAFNKSHSTCYAWIAYQTAYLKAHYPAEYMAAVLSNNMSDIKQVTFFMQECKKQKVPVLGPDVNESGALFAVNKKGEIRFGMAAVKGVGENAVESIVSERKEGPYSSIFDFMRRVDSKTGNKKVLESLALSGALDSFNISRSAFFAADGKNDSFIETLIRYGTSFRENKNSSQVSLFGDDNGGEVMEPSIPKVETWDTMTQLSKEKEVVGMFISGHPLDDFHLEISAFCSDGGLNLLQDLNTVKGRDLRFAGIVREAQHKMSQKGKPYGSFILEDYQNTFEFRLFGDDYLRFKQLLDNKFYLFVQGKVQNRGFGAQPGDLEFKITAIELLAEIREKRAKYLNLAIAVEKVNDKLVEQLGALLTNESGHAKLRIKLIDEATELNLPSGNMSKINIQQSLLDELERMPEISYSISEN
jgi:DNA polymerase-3 subunit alpha